MELEQFRTFWAERDSIVRAGEAWSNATLEKRVMKRSSHASNFDLSKVVAGAALSGVSVTCSGCRGAKGSDVECLSEPSRRCSVLRMEYEALNSSIVENLSAVIR